MKLNFPKGWSGVPASSVKSFFWVWSATMFYHSLQRLMGFSWSCGAVQSFIYFCSSEAPVAFSPTVHVHCSVFPRPLFCCSHGGGMCSELVNCKPQGVLPGRLLMIRNCGNNSEVDGDGRPQAIEIACLIHWRSQAENSENADCKVESRLSRLGLCLLWSWSGGSHCWSHCCPSSGTSNPSPLLCFTVLVSFGRDNAEQLFVFVILVSFERGIEWAAVPLRKTENLIPKVETDWELATSSGNKLPCWCIGLSKMAAFILTLGCICFEETWVAWLKRSYVHWLDRWLASSSTYDTVHCSLFTVHCSYYSRNDPHDFSTWKNTKGHLLRNKGPLAMNID